MVHNNVMGAFRIGPEYALGNVVGLECWLLRAFVFGVLWGKDVKCTLEKCPETFSFYCPR